MQKKAQIHENTDLWKETEKDRVKLEMLFSPHFAISVSLRVHGLFFFSAAFALVVQERGCHVEPLHNVWGMMFFEPH